MVHSRAALVAAIFVALLAALPAAGCDYSLDQASQACSTTTTAPACLQAGKALAMMPPQHLGFQWLSDNIFQPNCGGTDCHIQTTAGSLKGKFSLATGDAYESLLGKNGIGAPSDFAVGRMLVVPGNPDNSYLLFMMHGVPKIYGDPPYDEPPSDIGYMPQKNKTLCCQKLDALRDWIEQGAQP